MIRIRCRCGEVFYAQESRVGGSIRCRCGRTHLVRMPARPASRRPDKLLDRAAGAFARLRRARAAQTRRWTGWLAFAYLAFTVLVATLLWGFGDAWWPASFVLFGGRWVLLLPLVLCVPAALILLDGRALLVLGAAALMVLGPVMGLRCHLPPSEADVFRTRQHLRIVTLNADASRRVALDLPRLLEIWKVDVLALQECTGDVAGSAAAIRGWYHHADGSDLCLLSRYPIDRAEIMDRTALADVRAASVIGGAGFVARYSLRLPGGLLRLTNLHLETPRKGFEGLEREGVRDLVGNTELRAIEARLARRWADGDGDADVVAGDFNTPVESRIFRSAWGSFTDAFSAAGTGFGYTRHNGWIRARIDHVLTGSGWRPLRATVGGDVGSDHRPVIVDLAPDAG